MTLLGFTPGAEPAIRLDLALSFATAVGSGILIASHNRLRGRGDAPLPIKVLGSKPILQVELARK